LVVKNLRHKCYLFNLRH